MKFFLLAGEASGDLHGANLAKAIRNCSPSSTIVGWGGGKMEAAQVSILKHYKDLAIMGFIEVISKLPTIYKNLKLATNYILEHNIDAVVLIDFSGFNLRLAKRLRKRGYQGKIFYYISPKLWVWNAKRVKKIKSDVDAVFCILPFEVDFYEQHNYSNSYYIGNPLMDEIEAYQKNEEFFVQNQLMNKPIISLLPGSRKNEVKHILPIMLQVVSSYPDYQFVIAGVASMKSIIESELSKVKLDLPVLYNQTYDLVHHSEFVCVTSGTATLEVALLGTPFVICYKGSEISYQIAKRLVNIDFIGLPNLILKKQIAKELIQHQFTKETLKQELDLFLNNQFEKKNQFYQNQTELTQIVGSAGASNNSAQLMIELLKNA